MSELNVIIEQTGLEQSKSVLIAEKFEFIYDIAKKWEQQAREIIVTDSSQVEDMKKARTARLFLKDKRVSVEKTRKDLKEQSLREGKAIDAVANKLKSLITPIEEYLKEQECFVEIQEKKERDRIAAEEARLAEIQRKKEEEEAEKRRQAIEAENAKLRQEAAERDRKIALERQEREEAERKVREAHEKELSAQRERERQRQIESQRILIETQKKHAEEKRILEEKELKLKEEMKNTITCPHCNKTFVRTDG